MTKITLLFAGILLTVVSVFGQTRSPIFVTIGTGTSSGYSSPVNGYYNYSWSEQIYSAAEIGMAGMIDSLFFQVASVTSPYTMPNQRIYLSTSPVSEFSASVLPDTNAMTRVFSGTFTFGGAGWVKIPLSTPYSFDGLNNLHVVWINNDGAWSSGYPYFNYTTTVGNKTQFDNQDSSFPTDAGTLSTNRPNLKIAFANNTVHNSSMVEITSPVTSPTPIVGTPYDVKVIIKNDGADTLTNLTFDWSVNEAIQTPFSWSGSLAQDQISSEITIGSINFSSAGNKVIKIWSSNPDGFPDELPENDTIFKTLYVCSNLLTGTYTIDPLTPTGGTNFQYFSDVLGSLKNCGISDTTVFNIASGTYDTLLNFTGPIPGAGSTACVIFQSTSGNNSDVVLQNNATSTTNNFIVNLSGTSWVQFKNLSFQANGASYGSCVRLGNGSHNNLFEGNMFIGIATTSTSDDMSLFYNSGTANDSNITVRNNFFKNGSYAIYFAGNGSSNLENNGLIENNSFLNFYFRGIYSSNTNNLIIRNNEMKSNSASSSIVGLYLYYNDFVVVEKNNINIPNYYGIYLNYCDGSALQPIRIINNMVNVAGSASCYGLYLTYSNYVDVFHNTINVSSSLITGRAIFLSSGSEFKVRNNFLTNTGGGYSMYVSSTVTTYASDYNNLFTSGPILGYYNADISDFATWQTATLKDKFSVNFSPEYVSNTDLHTLAFSTNGMATPLGITEDIDDEPRNLTTPDMGADEFTPPPFEAGLVSAISPETGCGLGVEDVIIRVRNNGNDTIDGNFTATYVINNGTPVSEAITATILPMNTYDFTFATTVDMTVGANDSAFHFDAWVTLLNDNIHTNDSISFTAVSMHTPASVSVTNVTMPYATSTTLTATCTDTIQWYADAALTQLLATGASYTTPVLYDTTVYFLESSSGINYKYTFDNDLQGWSANTTCSYTSYNWAWNSDAGNGTAFMTDPDDYSSSVLQSPVMNFFGNSIDFSFRHRFDIESDWDHGFVVYRIDGGAWTLFTPTSNTYTGEDNFYNDPIFSSCGTNPAITSFYGTQSSYITSAGSINLGGGTQIEFAFVFGSDVSGSADGWFIDEVSVYKPGCPGQMTSDTVFVSVPATDVGVIAIDEPNSGTELTSNETVTVRVKNNGTAAASSIPVNFTVDAGIAVTETITGPINPGDTATFTFAAGANLSEVGTYNLAAYTTLSGDLFTINDTVKKLVVCSPIIYCASGATNTGDEDILNVTIGSLNNTSPAPHTMMYTDYTSITPAYLSHGQTYPMSVTETDDETSYWSGYIEAYIDFNHDGIFQEPEEVVLGGAYTSANQTNTITGNVTIPLTAYTGTTGMRVICWEGSTTTATTVVPCGTYGYGETEDYFVVLAPQIPNDAGVVSIDSPDYIQAENSQVPVVVTVRNFGTNTLSSIPVEYVLNGGIPVAYTWTGSLAPNATIQITLPDVTVVPDSNEICAYTLVVNDTNTFNDNACTYFYGLPPAIMFEDDMENGTQLYTDAPTLWEHGVPDADVINIANSPDNVWATNLDGDYPASASGFIYTPNINFFGVSGAYLTFYYWIDAQENSDGGYVQYTTNNGSTWTSLGTINDPNGFNWFDSYALGTPAWTIATGGWKPAFIKLNAVTGFSFVKFRFGFKSNTTVNNNGFAIDDIKILGPAVAIDGGVVEIVAPATSTTTGAATTVTVKIKNLGTDTLTTIPVSYKLNTGFPPQNGTWTGTLLPDSTVNYTFTQTYPGPAINYELCAYTNVSGDPYRGNDTACVSFNDIIGLEEATFNGVTLLQNAPNPASTQTEISFTLPAPGKCMLTLRNTLGELIQATTIDGQSGKNSVNVDLSNLGQGIYMYTLEYKEVVLTRRLSVIK